MRHARTLSGDLDLSAGAVMTAIKSLSQLTRRYRDALPVFRPSGRERQIARCGVRQPGGTCFCSRPQGHAGKHAAAGKTLVFSTWCAR
jgi:hypothetical protein